MKILLPRSRYLFVIVPLLLLCACTRDKRVKLTAVVEVDGVEYAGSVVNEYDCRRGGIFFGDTDGCNVRGDAGVIPLGPHGYAFLTMGYVRNASDVIPDSVAYGDTGGPSPTSWDVSLDYAPMLVRFSDINNPGTVEQIDPRHPEKTPGFVFKSVRGEVTKQPMSTEAVSKYLPWLDRAKAEKWGDLYGQKYSDMSLADTVGAHLSATNFERK